MGVRSFMADCITDVALDEDTAGDRCTLTPVDSIDSQGLPIVAVMGTPRASFLITEGNSAVGRRAAAVLSRTQARDVVRKLTGLDRDPDRQDFLVFTSGPWEGVWLVENGTPDIDDTIVLDVKWDRSDAIAAEGVRKQ